MRTLNAAMENAVEGIARLDTQGRYLSVNPAYAGMLGYRPEDLVGMGWQQTVPLDNLEKVHDAHRRMLDDGRAEVEPGHATTVRVWFPVASAPPVEMPGDGGER